MAKRKAAKKKASKRARAAKSTKVTTMTTTKTTRTTTMKNPLQRRHPEWDDDDWRMYSYFQNDVGLSDEDAEHETERYHFGSHMQDKSVNPRELGEPNPLRLGKQDKAVIRAFTERRAQDGHKLTTDGHRLDGYWMGGNTLVEWRDGKIHLPDTGSRSGQTVQNAIRREAPKNDLFNGRGWNPAPRYRIESDEATRAERDKIYTDSTQAHRDADRIRRRGPSAYADVQVDYGQGVWEAHERRNPKRNPELTDHEDELVLYIDNTASLYEDYKRITTRLIEMKQGRGTPRRAYGRTAAQARYSKGLVQPGAEMYRSEIDRSERWKAKEISRIAQDYAERFEKDYDSGELAWLGGPARPSNPGGKHIACGSEISKKDCRQLQHVYESAKDRGYSAERSAQQAWGSLRHNKRGRGRNPKEQKWIRVPGEWLRQGMIVKAPEWVSDFSRDDEPKIAWDRWPEHHRQSADYDGNDFHEPMPNRLLVKYWGEGTDDPDGESDLAALDDKGRELGWSYDFNTGAYPPIWFVEPESLQRALNLYGSWKEEFDEAVRQGQWPTDDVTPDEFDRQRTSHRKFFGENNPSRAKNPAPRQTSLSRRIRGS